MQQALKVGDIFYKVWVVGLHDNEFEKSKSLREFTFLLDLQL